MEDKYQIPRHLDDPFKIIIFTIDEFLILVVPFFIGLWVINAPITGLLIGAAGVFGLKKLKGAQGHYYLYQLMYWYLPPLRKLHSTPPSYMREFLG